MINFRFSSITTSDGTITAIPPSGVVVFVGPNNAGKSQALKDLVGHLRNGDQYLGKTVTGIEASKFGSVDDALAWASTSLPKSNRDGVNKLTVPGWGEVGPSDFGNQWARGGPNLGILTDSLVLYADGTTRLTAANAQENLDFRVASPSHPIQRAYLDPTLEAEFRSVARSAFGLDVAVDRYGGSLISLRVGTRPEFTHNEGIPSEAYLQGLADMPQLEAQGDGVRSFIGLMTQLIAGSHKVIMVDEPEAFLHPPQARLLGRMLAERASDQQVFLATHSSAILQGVLDAGAPVTIVRLTREASVNRAATLADAAVAELWSDPLLRYSNVLEGLFYDAVILCESDSDCRYYAAVRDHLFPEGNEGRRRLELLFVQSGGKARLAVVIRALRAVQVPVVVVTDFDMLRVEGDVKRTYEALEGDWAGVASQRKLVADALAADSKPLRKVPLADALADKFSSLPEILSTKDVEVLRSILKAETGWDKVKRSGISGVPQGDPFRNAEELITELAKNYLLVVPVGELERFVPSVAGHGPGWVTAVLEKRLHLTPSPEAENFVSAIEATALSASGANF